MEERKKVYFYLELYEMGKDSLTTIFLPFLSLFPILLLPGIFPYSLVPAEPLFQAREMGFSSLNSYTFLNCYICLYGETKREKNEETNYRDSSAHSRPQALLFLVPPAREAGASLEFYIPMSLLPLFWSLLPSK